MKLFLQLQIGTDAYVLDASRVATVLPLVAAKAIPRAPRGIVGAFRYRGASVPLLDLSELALGRRSRPYLSTRVILVPFAPGGTDTRGGERLLGLVAEQVTQTVRCDPLSFAPAGVHPAETPYLGPMATIGDRQVQWIEIADLLPPEVSEVLFREVEVA